MFSIALVSYFLTVEETASLWDCSEFIAASTKLQVPHPPGAPPSSIAVTLLIYDVVISGIPALAGKLELYFVNSIGLAFGSGALVFAILCVGIFIYLIHYTHRRNLAAWNTLLLAGTFVIIGYGSYAIIAIRSGFDPPMNQNAPEDVMSFVRYLNREQYGSRPLLYGPDFTSQPVGIRYGDPVYIKGSKRKGRRYGTGNR